jgi:3-phosphoshikimate 1-carboxyvinyltransferase
VTIREKVPTRDHTERLIAELGGAITVEEITADILPDPVDPRKKIKSLPTQEYKRAVHLKGCTPLNGGVIDIPGDVSTAAYFIAAALMVPGSHLILKDVGVNATRCGFIHLLKQMGADITIANRREVSGEARGDIEIRPSELKPRKVSGDSIPGLIDEIPILAILAATISGTTIIRDASELRHKESDRISGLVRNLSLMGVKVGEFPDGLAIEGGGELSGAEIDPVGDHRIAMAFAVAGLVAHGDTVIKNGDVVPISCPRFFTMLEGLRQ